MNRNCSREVTRMWGVEEKIKIYIEEKQNKQKKVLSIYKKNKCREKKRKRLIRK